MTKPQIALLGAALYTAAVFTSATAATVNLPQYGFTIEALDAPASATTATTALMTFLPPSDGFAPNINVSIQPYSGSITNYISMSKDQFTDMNCTIVTDKQNGESEWIVEYTGRMQGNNLHFYARAVANKGKVYLVTATAKETQWNSVSEILRKTVGAFTTQ